jgi:hypothetical protein
MRCETCKGTGVILPQALPPGARGIPVRLHGGPRGPVVEVICPDCMGRCFDYCCSGDIAQPGQDD